MSGPHSIRGSRADPVFFIATNKSTRQATILSIRLYFRGRKKTSSSSSSSGWWNQIDKKVKRRKRTTQCFCLFVFWGCATVVFPYRFLPTGFGSLSWCIRAAVYIGPYVCTWRTLNCCVRLPITYKVWLLASMMVQFYVASAEWAKHLCSLMLYSVWQLLVRGIEINRWDMCPVRQHMTRWEAKPKAILLFSHLLGAVQNKEPMETWHRFFDMVVVLLGNIRREIRASYCKP